MFSRATEMNRNHSSVKLHLEEGTKQLNWNMSVRFISVALHHHHHIRLFMVVKCNRMCNSSPVKFHRTAKHSVQSSLYSV